MPIPSESTFSDYIKENRLADLLDLFDQSRTELSKSKQKELDLLIGDHQAWKEQARLNLLTSEEQAVQKSKLINRLTDFYQMLQEAPKLPPAGYAAQAMRNRWLPAVLVLILAITMGLLIIRSLGGGAPTNETPTENSILADSLEVAQEPGDTTTGRAAEGSSETSPPIDAIPAPTTPPQNRCPTLTSKVQIKGLRRAGSLDSFALASGKKLPLAKFGDNFSKLKAMDHYYLKNSAAFELTIATSESVVIQDIIATVSDYQPLPEGVNESLLGGKGRPMFLVPLSPKKGKNNAVGFLKLGQLQPGYHYEIDPGERNIYVKFVGTKPGQYTFSAQLQVLINDEPCTIDFLPAQTWVFMDL